jgi:crotonobetainyl-CoA:carnitine CoA-transferase CaiB-like acyl-CoA transferase
MGEAIDLAPAPAHGEHTDRLLGEIGFDTRQIAELRSARVVR